jgi:hypothetical protein
MVLALGALSFQRRVEAFQPLGFEVQATPAGTLEVTAVGTGGVGVQTAIRSCSQVAAKPTTRLPCALACAEPRPPRSSWRAESASKRSPTNGRR